MIWSFLLVIFLMVFNSNRRVFKYTFLFLLVIFHIAPNFYVICMVVVLQAGFYYFNMKGEDKGNEVNKLILNRPKSNN
jgi:hypothetical protein